MKKIWIIAILIIGIRAYSGEIERMRALQKWGIKRAIIVNKRLKEIFKEQPEMKKYIMQPSKRNILGERGKGPGIDTVKVLAIRVEFQENPMDSLATGNGRMRTWRDFTVNESGDTVLVPPFDSLGHNLAYDPPHTKRYFEHLMEFIKNYYWKNSQGHIYIDFTVAPEAESLSYQLPYQIYYYGDPDNYVEGLLTLLRDALIACDEQDTIKMSRYDAYIIFHPGCSWQSSYIWGDSPYDIFACQIRGLDKYFGTPVWVDNGTHPITDGIIYPESDFKYGVPSFLQGGLTHEFGHQLGFFDLYDTYGETIGAGGWCLMGTGNWNLSGLLPPNFSAWHREYLNKKVPGLVNIVNITRDTTDLEIYRTGGWDTSRVKLYKIPVNSKEYWLVSNRFVYANPDTTGVDSIFSPDSTLHYDSTGVRVWRDGVLTRFDDYDWGLPPDSMRGGLAIWHIDEDKIARDSSWNEINAGDLKGVDMEEADGIQDFETKVWLVTDADAAYYGSPYDLFYKGNLDSFTPFTLPNTNANNGSFSHVRIYNISESDTLMKFSVKFNFKKPGFPISCGSFFDINSPNIAEVDTEYVIFTGVMDTLVGNVVLALKSDGSILWKHTIPTAQYLGFYGSVAIGDIDGNEVLDVVATPFTAKDTILNPKSKIQNPKQKFKKDFQSSNLSIFESKADTSLKIWGQLYAWDVYGNPLLSLDGVTDGAIIGVPLLADINEDGKDEIIITSGDGNLYCFNGDGTSVDGFPVSLGQMTWGSPVYDSISNRIYALSGDGRLFSIKTTGEMDWIGLEPSLEITYSSPVVADLDSDGKNEIICSRGTKEIVCVKSDSRIEWKRTLTNFSFISSPAVADIDNDSYLDVIVPAGNKIYCFNHSGASLPGFPIEVESEEEFLQSSPVVGDITGDGKNEIVIGSPDGKLFAYNNTGNLLPFFPLNTGRTIYSTPLLTDIDSDSLVDIVVGCDDGNLYTWGFPWEYGVISWGSIHKDGRNNGIILKQPIHPVVTGNPFMDKNLYIYPNPIRDKGAHLHYTPGDADEVNIKLVDVAGNIKKSFKGKIGGNSYVDVSLQLDGLTSGVYLCRVEATLNGKRYVRFKKFGIVK